RHQYLRYERLQYTNADIADFEMRLARIYRREIFDIRGSLVHELILEFFSAFRFGKAILDLDTPGALQFQLGEVRRDPMLRLCHRLIACSITRRSQGFTVIVRYLPVIDMAKLVRLQICIKLDNTWSREPTGPVRKEGDAGGVAEEAPVAPEGGDEDEEMPQAMPPLP
nr:hypothetical protein [Tanacetum cinerariifolium]